MSNFDPEAISASAKRLGLQLTETDLEFLAAALVPLIDAQQRIDEFGQDGSPAALRDIAFHYPDRLEDPFNCWRVKGTIIANPTGENGLRRVGVKDNIAVAGLPCANGTELLANFVPREDATVIARLLAAGATIIGKTNCEAFAASGGSHLNDFGEVHNPRAPGRTSGGSSSGSAAAVAAGECDWALGTDQGGSTRVPAAFCGVVGLKPTWGRVPYTGAMPVENTLDHIGLITANVAENARMLGIVAGTDGRDARQCAGAEFEYVRDFDFSGTRVGLVAEGFGHANSEIVVDNAVHRAADTLVQLGAVVEEVSIPAHRQSRAIFLGIACSGVAAQFLGGSGYALNTKGPFESDYMTACRAFQDQYEHLPDPMLLLILLGSLTLAKDGGLTYANSQNAARRLRQAYDSELDRYDVLLMPTVPMRAPPLPARTSSRTERLLSATDMFANTSAFNVTGHPALSVPCGHQSELPIGMMLISKHHEENRIYAVAEAYEARRNEHRT